MFLLVLSSDNSNFCNLASVIRVYLRDAWQTVQSIKKDRHHHTGTDNGKEADAMRKRAIDKDT